MPDVPRIRNDVTTPEPWGAETGHRTVISSPLGYTRQCMTCFAVLILHPEFQAWADGPGLVWLKGLQAAMDAGTEADYPDLDEERAHVVGIGPSDGDGGERRPEPVAIDDDAEGDDLLVNATKAASRVFRAARAVPAPEPVKRPAPAGYEFLGDPEAEAAMAKSVLADHRRAQAIAAGIPAHVARPGKSKLSRSTEYRRVEKRRQMARREGLDPDGLGPEYRLPTLKTLDRVSFHPRKPSMPSMFDDEAPRGRR